MVRRSALPKVLCLTSALLLLAFLSTSQAQDAKITKIKMSYPNAALCCLPIFAAQKWTIFSANGLEVLAIRMGSRIAAAALWNGELVV